MADSQRKRVYAAEFQLRDYLERGGTVVMHGSTLELPPEFKFGSLDHVQIYCDRLADAEGVSRVNVVGATKPRRNEIDAHYIHGTIYIPVSERDSRGNWAAREVVVLHEFAHHLTRFEEAHGAAFCGAFVYLLERYVGPETGWLMRILLDDHDCKVSVHTGKTVV